jgi:hypothetical protein
MSFIKCPSVNGDESGLEAHRRMSPALVELT